MRVALYRLKYFLSIHPKKFLNEIITIIELHLCPIKTQQFINFKDAFQLGQVQKQTLNSVTCVTCVPKPSESASVGSRNGQVTDAALVTEFSARVLSWFYRYMRRAGLYTRVRGITEK